MGDQWKTPSSPTGGVRAFNIAGRMVDERERLYHRMTDEERRWRAQWCKDQILEPGESLDNLPREWFVTTKHWLRRAYMAPLDKLGYFLAPRVGFEAAYAIRYGIGKYVMGFIGFCVIHYQMKYNRHEWWKASGFDVYISRPKLYPDDEGYLKVPELPDEAYYDRGFHKSPLYQKSAEEKK